MNITLTIDRLGHHGDGIGAGPTGPVRAAGLLPGEVATGTLAGDRLLDPRIITPAPARRRPPCPHARSCGGCALQHADDEFVAAWKQQVVARALMAQGLPAALAGIATSPPASRRRATLAGRRGKGGVTLGFHRRGSDQVVAIPDCRLLHPDLMALLPALAVPVQLGAARKGALALTVTATLTGADVAVTGGKPLDPGLRMALGAWVEEQRIARLTWDGEVIAQRTPPLVALGPARVALPPGAFLQATAAGEAALVATVRAALGPARRVADLFAGCGTFALPLATTADVHAVEGLADLTAALAAAARMTPGLRRVTTETRDLFRRPLLAAELAAFDAVVIDPPRAGAAQQVAEIARAGVPVVAMVSCNPVTFARDARTLCTAGYRMAPPLVVDQFRWSPHVELATHFTRRD